MCEYPFTITHATRRVLLVVLVRRTCRAGLKICEQGVRMPPVISCQQDVQPAYQVVAPDGDHIEISVELFSALWDFLRGTKPTGSLIIQFRNGGIAGLEAIIKKLYK